MGNKIAILADIHGNSAALKAVLNNIDNDTEHIYCLGDLVGIGHETDEVLEILSSRNDVSCIIGNHDQAIIKIIHGEEPDSYGEEREHHQWIASRLNEKYVPFLSNLPLKIEKKICNKHFLFVHYHLNDNQTFQSIDRRPTLEKLDECYRKQSIDIICFGHHHMIHHFKSNKRLYLNPGSLGCNHNPVAPYCTIHVNDSNQLSNTFNEVPYDNRQFLLAYEKLNVPAKDFILNVFHGDQHKQLK
ncbi:metallophosphoesterase family protein [Heyndrickxia oleronia]|uniref:metallophosphoesterase family protein n=1 Tax=Heyndrickxia oleronia TaxID=38875 RepID=UPI001B1A0868|nr:metallophosphoesterase family protein [Heyndrickxia oleronia]GIN37261.1 phosphodiesterase [Heyndrickxia oleronia]